MEQDELFADWEARAKAIGLTLADVRAEAEVHAPNFSNWRRGKGGMTLASIRKVESAVRNLEARAAAQKADAA